MEQLSGLDAAFLALDTRRTTGHVGGVHLVDAVDDRGRALTLDRLTALVAERLHLVPPMRRRVVDVPFGLDHPYWVQDAEFDLEFHVRDLALPAPGSWAQLSEQVARIHSRPLDRARPLWELYLVHGLGGGRCALYAKLHHAMIDGLGGQEVTAALLDPTPQGRRVPPAPPWRPEAEPSALGLLGRATMSLAARPGRIARFVADLARSAPGIGEDVIRHPPGRAPATPFNHNVSAHRRIALRAVPLDVVKAVKDATGTTVNDVVLAACAGALRHWLAAHDALPAEPLVAAVPVSVRAPAGRRATGDGRFGNRVSLLLADLPTDLDDPVRRIRAVHRATLAAKSQHQALPANLLADAYQVTLPALMTLTTRANSRLRVLERAGLFNLFVSNVPGPAAPLYLAGHRVLESYPVSAVTDGQGLNITALSYLGGLHFGLTADRELVPDLEALADRLVTEVTDLARLTGTDPAT